jgi:hypothetical protein
LCQDSFFLCSGCSRSCFVYVSVIIVQDAEAVVQAFASSCQDFFMDSQNAGPNVQDSVIYFRMLVFCFGGLK